MPRQEIVGTAVGTELAADMTSGSTSFTVVDASGWPTGGGGNPFTVTIGKGTASEEKILCASRTGTTIAVTTRGYDGTTAAAHQTGVGVIHSISAVVLNEANAHVNDTTRDDHTQYLNTTRHDVEVRHQFGGALGVPSAPADIGTAAATGSGDDAAREDHVHKIGAGAINSTGMFDAALYGGAPANVGTSPSAGAAATVSRSDHVHDLGNSSINDPTLFATGLRPVFIVADATALAALTPTKGDLAFQVDVNKLLEYTTATTGWVPPWNLPWGRMGGSGDVTAAQTVTGTAVTNLTSLTTGAITYVANRRLLIKSHLPITNGAATGFVGVVYITDGSNVIKEASRRAFFTASDEDTLAPEIEIVTAAGAATYKLRAKATTAGGTVITLPDSDQKAWISVYDLGPSAAPA